MINKNVFNLLLSKNDRLENISSNSYLDTKKKNVLFIAKNKNSVEFRKNKMNSNNFYFSNFNLTLKEKIHLEKNVSKLVFDRKEIILMKKILSLLYIHKDTIKNIRYKDTLENNEFYFLLNYITTPKSIGFLNDYTAKTLLNFQNETSEKVVKIKKIINQEKRCIFKEDKIEKIELILKMKIKKILLMSFLELSLNYKKDLILEKKITNFVKNKSEKILKKIFLYLKRINQLIKKIQKKILKIHFNHLLKAMNIKKFIFQKRKTQLTINFKMLKKLAKNKKMILKIFKEWRNLVFQKRLLSKFLNENNSEYNERNSYCVEDHVLNIILPKNNNEVSFDYSKSLCVSFERIKTLGREDVLTEEDQDPDDLSQFLKKFS